MRLTPSCATIRPNLLPLRRIAQQISQACRKCSRPGPLVPPQGMALPQKPHPQALRKEVMTQ